MLAIVESLDHNPIFLGGSMKSPIRWAGSKKALLPMLRQYWQGGEGRYIEPFCGSACLFFDLEPKEALLGDLNGELISAYNTIGAQPMRVFECLMRLPINKKTYYRLRSIKPDGLSDSERAARFLYLNRLAFNGIYRTNKSGQFNVPYGKPKSRVKFGFEELMAAATLLKRAALMHCDFETMLSAARSEDFVYLDPPYAVSARRIFAEYHPDTFSEKDLERLQNSLVGLNRLGAKFVISYADSAEGRALVRPWNHKRIRTKRNVAGFVGARRTAYEVVATNLELH